MTQRRVRIPSARIDVHGALRVAPQPVDDGVRTLGWAAHGWKAADGPKQPCAKCRRGVRRGVQHHRNKGPGRPILCTPCYDGIMADPGPGGWASEGSN